MLAARPFANDEAVENVAHDIADVLIREDWLEAFAAHPRIGDVATLRERFANTKDWSDGEQAGVELASEATIRELARLNDQYFEKFGYIFIVCATGKSADQILQLLRKRLPNDPTTELALSSAEQRQITILRLRKLTS